MTNQEQANRRFVSIAIVAFAAFLAVDAYLFASDGFLRMFGAATQEGQVRSKVNRAERQAEIADVVLFGSSYVRSGLAGEPFLERGILPFNLAVSGGGPLLEYFALKRIAPVLQRRTVKPLLVLELKTDALMRLRNSAWSEYPQYSAIVRSRSEMVQEWPRLWANFRDFKMTSQLLSGLVIPSGIYRSQAVPMLGARVSLDGYFYGTEDFSGFSPLYTTAVPAMVPGGPPQPPLTFDKIWPGKIDFVRAFMALARTTGCQVVLYESPTIMLGRDSAMLNALIDQLSAEFGDLRVIRTADVVREVGDFDEGGHLNIKGADETARRLIASLGLSGDQAALARKLDLGFEKLAVPDMSQWVAPGARATGLGADLTIQPVAEPSGLIAQSPPFKLNPPGEWVLELAMPELTGRLSVEPSWVEDGVERRMQYVTPVEAPRLGGSTRMFIRMSTTADVTVKIFDYNLLTGGEPSAGRVRVLRLWKNR